MEIDQEGEEEEEERDGEGMQLGEERKEVVAAVSGKRAWTVEEVAKFFKTGERPDI